jgi:hypothetical protein
MRQRERKLQSISLFYLERAMTRDCFVSAGVEQITSCVGEEGRHVRASIFSAFLSGAGEGKDMLYNKEEGRAASKSHH